MLMLTGTVVFFGMFLVIGVVGVWAILTPPRDLVRLEAQEKMRKAKQQEQEVWANLPNLEDDSAALQSYLTQGQYQQKMFEILNGAQPPPYRPNTLDPEADPWVKHERKLKENENG